MIDILSVDDNMTSSVCDPRPIHLYFGHRVTVPSISKEFRDTMKSLSHRVIICNSWGTLIELLKLNPVSIAVCAREFKSTSIFEIVNMIKTLSKLVGVEDMPIAVAVYKDTDFVFVKQLQKNEIHGIIPGSANFGFDETMRGLVALWAGIPYWPRHIIDQLSGARPKKVISGPLPEIRLTVRQQQILDLVVERGASNKVIARTLSIGESTVKLHLGNIFRKYGVKNRTQLAVFSRRQKTTAQDQEVVMSY